ncbi:MAG: DUF1638 domain-containing protein [Arenicella sp.]|nr:DUF1638 domain-containing protein [Arenicella sp.]
MTLQPQDAVRKRLVLGCGALAYDMVDLIKKNEVLDQVVDIQCLPAKLHHTPQFIAAEVEKVLAARVQDYADIYVAYGDCGTAGELDKVLQKYNAKRIPGEHCFEFFAGAGEYAEITEAELGSFFLTDFLVKQFDHFVIEGLGLDRYPELFDVYFEHYTQMVYLAQTEDPKLQEKARAYAEDFGMKYIYRYVGVSALAPLVEGLAVEVNHA